MGEVGGGDGEQHQSRPSLPEGGGRRQQGQHGDGRKDKQRRADSQGRYGTGQKREPEERLGMLPERQGDIQPDCGNEQGRPERAVGVKGVDGSKKI